VTTTQHRAYSAPMHTGTADVAPEARKPHEASPAAEWRALWALEDGQPAWLWDSVAALDGAIQGQMGHT
jgi:hypothetical protein